MKKMMQFGKSKSSKPEDDLSLDQDFIYNCKVVYLTVLSGLDERITSLEELKLLLQYAGKNPSSRSIKKHWDHDTGYLTFQQFCEVVRKEPTTKPDKLLAAFHKIDTNGDGYLSHKELAKLLTTRGEALSKSELSQIIDDADFNGDGRLDYQEFCNLMMSTIRKCSEKHSNQSTKNRKGYLSRMSNKQHHSSHESIDEDQNYHRRPTTEKRNTVNNKRNSVKKEQPLTEPDSLSKWNYQCLKGSIYHDDDTIKSCQYQITVKRDTDAWITIHAASPKYGQFDETILHSDFTTLLIDSEKQLIDFSTTLIEEKSCMSCYLGVGRYTLIVFSSGIHLKYTRDHAKRNKSQQPKLIKGEGEQMKLSRACRDALTEIFYRSDIDGNGYLNRNEFNQFQIQTTGEQCDDDAWDVVKENFEMNNNMELTPEGFLNLNLLEAKDPDGNGPDDLWVTLQAMGYSEMLVLNKACPYQLDVFTNATRVNAIAEAVQDVANKYQEALINCITMVSSTSSVAIDGNDDIRLYTWKTQKRTTLAVQNSSLSPVRVRVNCTESNNALSSRDTLDTTVSIRPQKFQIAHHLVPLDNTKSMKLHCRTTFVN